MKTGIMSFTNEAKTDSKLRARVLALNTELQNNGLPKTLEGLKEMYAVYNLIYGKNKKPTNCIYCRLSIKDYIQKAVLLLDIEISRKPKPEPIAKAQAPKTKPKGNGPTKPKKRK